MNKLRLVLDTNLVISAALLETSFARKAFELALTRGEILLSQATQADLSDVFMRSKFDRYVSPVHRLQFLANLIATSTSVQITERIQACRDPKDDKLLELAVNGKADCLITGDKDLLVLHPFRGIPILTPNDFMDKFSLLQ
jgi:putative PIN family toxin of toxin-antitoxin system